MTSVEVPSERYYEALRQDLGERHPEASPFVLDHLLSLEVFLGVSICSGFSFGCAKASILVSEGNLLGRVVGRDGVSGDVDRAEAVRKFAPMKEVKHLQQFWGCTNWLRPHLPVECVRAVKVLSPFMREGAVFPPEGLGVGTTDADKAVQASKLLKALAPRKVLFCD